MSIERTPGVDYYELDSNPSWTGEGAEIPIIIGLTEGTISTLSIQKFKNYAACNKTVANGGIGIGETNPVRLFLKNFFEETQKTQSDDISVPYVYVIALGSTATNQKWLEAMALAKTKREVQVEAFVGLQGVTTEGTTTFTNVISIMSSAETSITNDSKQGNPRIGYYSVDGITDAQIVSLTDDTGASGSFLQKSRIILCEPTSFAKDVARVCVTPYYDEPGFYEFRTISTGVYNKRTDAQELTLQNAGILFVRDELTRIKTYPKINLAVSTAFAKDPSDRPNDALLHARRNTDNLIRRIYDVCYTQLKRNETETNLCHLQTDIDTIVDEEISKGRMMKGTQVLVNESNSDPYSLTVDGNAVPVNSTLGIGFGMYISLPNTTVND